MAASTSRSWAKDQIAEVPFEALTGLKAFVIANALADIRAPRAIISPLVQHLPRLWELVHDFGMTTLELNPIRMRPDARGRLTPVACDLKCGFDRDDPRWERLGLPAHLFAADQSEFETEINQLRTHQGQSDVYVINPNGTILAPTFGGGANSLVTEVLGDDAIISSDFGGNPPYEKMKEVARICFKYWLAQSQRAVHHRRQVEQHRHPHHLPRHGRRLARAFRRAGADAALRGGRPGRAEPDPRHGIAPGHAGGAGRALPLLRLRLRRSARSSTTRKGSTAG